MGLFKRHNWPGNFRQLTNLLRTAIVMAGDDHEIRIEHLPDDFLEDIAAPQTGAPDHAHGTGHGDKSANAALTPGATLEDVELSVIHKSLEAHGGNVSATARALGVSRNTIYRKLHP